MAINANTANRKVLQNLRTSTQTNESILSGLTNLTALGEIAIKMGTGNNVEEKRKNTSIYTLAADGQVAVRFPSYETVQEMITGGASIYVNNIIDAVGLQDDGKIISGDTSVWGTETTYFNSASTVVDAVKALDTNLNALSGYVADSDYELAHDDNKVVDSLKQVDGRISGTSVNVTSVKLGGYVEPSGVNADNTLTEVKVASTDTLGEALSKLQKQVNSMDKTTDVQTGKVVTTVIEADGIVTETKAYLTDITLSGYVKDTTKVGAIADTDTVEGAFSKVENAIAANAITNADGSINVTSAATGTDINVNIKSGEKVLAKDGNAGLYTDIKLSAATAEQVATLGTNVKEAYRLLATNDDQLGDWIKIYKDSSLVRFYLGHVDDVLTNADQTTHESPDSGVTEGTGSEALVYIVQLANGNYQLTTVDVESFLQEAEFKDGLQVVNHEVSVKKDPASEQVILDYALGTSGDVLTISENGVKVANIQAAIDAAVGKAQTIVNTAVTSTDETKSHLTITESTGNDGSKTYSFTTNDIASEDELDATQVGAGLNDDGSYSANTSTMYVSAATSLKTADEILDAKLYEETLRAQSAETQLDAVIGADKGASEARTYGHSGTNYLDNNTTVKSDVESLDDIIGIVDNTPDDYDVTFSSANTIAQNISDIKRALDEYKLHVIDNKYIDLTITTGSTGTSIEASAITMDIADSTSGSSALVDSWDAKQYAITDRKASDGMNSGADSNIKTIAATNDSGKLLDFSEIVVDCGTF